MKKTAGWVYLAETRHNGARVCKIGYTLGSVKRRLDRIRAGNPEPLDEYASFWHPFAKRTEKRIHKKLEAHNLKCGGGEEFFHWDGEVLQTFKRHWESSSKGPAKEWTREVPRPAPKPAPVPTPAPRPIMVETPRATSSYVAPSPRLDLSSWGPVLVVVILSLFAVKGCLDAASDRVNATVDGWFETLKSMKK